MDIGTRIYFVNGSLHDDSPVGKISHDFSRTDASEMKEEAVAKQFATVKQQELKTMDTFTQRIFEEGLKSGEELGRASSTSRDVSRVLEPCFFVHIRLTIAGVYRIIQYRCVMGMFRMKTESIERKSR